MGLSSCRLQGLFKKLNRSNKTKCVNKCGKKNKRKIIIKPLFVALLKIGDWIRKYVQICQASSFQKRS